MNQDRGKPLIVYVEEPSDSDRLSLGRTMLARNFSGRVAARQRDELRKQLEEKPVNSIEDVCSSFGIRIEGEYKNVDGQKVQASIAVQNEETFSPQGVTLGDPQLFDCYVSCRTFETIAEGSDEEALELLSDEEIAYLENTEQMLDRSLQGGQS